MSVEKLANRFRKTKVPVASADERLRSDIQVFLYWRTRVQISVIPRMPGDNVRRIFSQRAESFFIFLQLLLNKFYVMNVRGSTVPFTNFTVFVSVWNGAGEVPTVSTVLHAEAMLLFKNGSFLKRPQPCSRGCLSI